jgi:hypothetical protein
VGASQELLQIGLAKNPDTVTICQQAGVRREAAECDDSALFDLGIGHRLKEFANHPDPNISVLPVLALASGPFTRSIENQVDTSVRIRTPRRVTV